MPRKSSKPSAVSTDAGAQVRRLYVLDTNVLMHDPAALYRFDEHDIYLPMVVLEELDHHKKGVSEPARSTYSNSASLGRRYFLPVRCESQATYSLASFHETLSTGSLSLARPPS